MRSDSDLHETRTDAEQSETGGGFRVSFESRGERRFQSARRDRSKSQGAHLYFIKIAKGRGPVKIGRANDPQQRLATLQVASPYGLKLLGILDNCGESEMDWHLFLGASRMRGEWFAWSTVVEETVSLALSGGDWRTVVAEPARSAMDDAWRIGSPLYAPTPSRTPSPEGNHHA